MKDMNEDQKVKIKKPFNIMSDLRSINASFCIMSTYG